MRVAVGSSLVGSRPDPEVLFGPAAALAFGGARKSGTPTKNHPGADRRVDAKVTPIKPLSRRSDRHELPDRDFIF
jgi:hypothetical protein